MGAALVDLLRRNGGHWVQMEGVCLALDLAPPQVHELIGQLQEMGYEIEASPVNGFRLLGSADQLSADMIEYGLGTRRVGRKVLVYETTESTNDVAWHYAAEKDYDGLAVFAGFVTIKHSSLRRLAAYLEAYPDPRRSDGENR